MTGSELKISGFNFKVVLLSRWFYLNILSQDLKESYTSSKKIIRFVLNLHPRFDIGKEQFNSLHWLPAQSRVNQIFLCHVLKYIILVCNWSYLI